MEEQLVSLEVAKLLKEKGFPQVYNRINISTLPNCYSYLSVPTQSLAQKWLRETKKVIFLVDYLVKDEVYLFSILVNNVWYNLHYRAIYEEALEEALKEALKLI